MKKLMEENEALRAALKAAIRLINTMGPDSTVDDLIVAHDAYDEEIDNLKFIKVEV